MGNLAQLDLGNAGRTARLRALLEDMADYHKGVYPQNPLALAVWFEKSQQEGDQHLLELFAGPDNRKDIKASRFSLLWKTGSEGAPYVDLHTTSVTYFSELVTSQPDRIRTYQTSSEVLFFDKKLLSREILDAFGIATEPAGLIKGWYVTEAEYKQANNMQRLLATTGSSRPYLGLVKVEESPDFQNCRGLIQGEISQKWVPVSPDGVRAFSYFNDLLAGRDVYFLFEGGSLYQVLKFEIKIAPEYGTRLLGKTVDDRYPEVYLRAVRPLAAPAA